MKKLSLAKVWHNETWVDLSVDLPKVRALLTEIVLDLEKVNVDDGLSKLSFVISAVLGLMREDDNTTDRLGIQIGLPRTRDFELVDLVSRLSYLEDNLKKYSELDVTNTITTLRTLDYFLDMFIAEETKRLAPTS